MRCTLQPALRFPSAVKRLLVQDSGPIVLSYHHRKSIVVRVYSIMYTVVCVCVSVCIYIYGQIERARAVSGLCGSVTFSFYLHAYIHTYIYIYIYVHVGIYIYI